MRMRWFLVCLLVATFGSAAAIQAAEALKVCLVSGSLEYHSQESLEAYQKYLEEHYPIVCSRAFIEGRNEENLPGLENLDTCDVMLLFTRRLKLSGEQLERFKKYCLAGKPIVGVRTASHAVQSWLDLDKLVLNGNYHGHYGAGPETVITVTEAGQKHPIMAGFTPFRSAGSLYKNSPLPEGNDVLMLGANPEHTEPITWTREFKGARIFYTSLGHPQDFTEESFRRMLANALFWTARQEPRGK